MSDMGTQQALATISPVAARQGGLVTGAQIDRLGVGRADRAALTRSAMLTRLDWDVFEVLGSPTPPRYAYPYAAWLALAPATFGWERPAVTAGPTADAVFSHDSAAQLLGLGAPSAGRVVFTAPEARPAPRAIRVIGAALRADEVVTHAGLPVTTAHRTVLDLAADGIDSVELGRILTDAVRRDLLDLAAVYRALAPQAGRSGFPADGPGFAAWFLPALAVSAGARPPALSPRNAHALAALLSAGPVR